MRVLGRRWAGRVRASIMQIYDTAVKFAIERHRFVLVVLGVLFVVACYGFSHLKFDSSMTSFFRNTTELSRNYESYLQRFEASDRDVLVVVSSETPFDAAALQDARLLHLDLTFVEGVSDVFSLFSLRTAWNGEGATAPLVPEPLPQGAAFNALMDRISAEHGLADSFLSADRRRLLLIVTIPPDYDPAFNSTLVGIEEVAARHDSEELTVGLTGYNVLRGHIRRAAKHDMVVFNTAGFLVGLMIALATLRSFRYVLIASVPPAMAVVLIIGGQGLFGVPLQSLTTIVPSLVLLVVFNNSTHLVFEVRRRIAAGASANQAIRRAMHVIGPPCALSTFITAAAVFTLAWTPSAAVRNFGWIGSIATLGGMACVFILLPPLAAAVLGGASTRSAAKESPVVRWLRRFSISIGMASARHARLIIAIGCAVAVVSGVLFWNLQPRLRLSDQIPRHSDTLDATAIVDREFGGINLVAIVISDQRADGTLLDPDFRAIIEEVHAAAENAPHAMSVTSLATVERMAAASGPVSDARLAELMEEMPSSLRNRIVSKDGKAALVTFRLPDLYADELAAILTPLNATLIKIDRDRAEASIALTGLAALVAFEGPRMIGALQQNNIQTFLFAIVLIGLFFRSPRLMIAALPVNLLPLLAVGAARHLAGAEIDFASSIALTVALGLSVDDTIHIIHRWRLLNGRGYGREATMARVLGSVGPVVMLTTTMLIAGLAVSRLSINPNLQTFSVVMGSVLLLTLICQCVLLPALLARLSEAPGRGLRQVAGNLSRSAAALIITLGLAVTLSPRPAAAQSGYEALAPFVGEWRGTGVGRENPSSAEESILCLSTNELQETRFVILARCNAANARVVFNAWLTADGGAYTGTYQRTTRTGGEQDGSILGSGGGGALDFTLSADGAQRGHATLTSGSDGYTMVLRAPEGGEPLLDVTFAPSQ